MILLLCLIAVIFFILFLGWRSSIQVPNISEPVGGITGTTVIGLIRLAIWVIAGGG